MECKGRERLVAQVYERAEEKGRRGSKIIVRYLLKNVLD
jgi:hypothetical protein